MRHSYRRSLLTVTILCLSHSTSIRAQSATPKQAEAVGYTVLTFVSTFGDSTVDVSGNNASGFQWYVWDFFGKRAKPSELHFNADHTLTLAGGPTGPNGEIATAAATSVGGKFAGIAFGGGAYIEATLKFNPTDVARTKYVGHPSFWSMALEHLVGYGDSGGVSQASKFEHFIEADFFEYDLLRYLHKQNVYGGALRDWYGIWKTTCPTGLCNITTPYAALQRWMPSSTDFTHYHTYGFLWVPATSQSAGYAQFYFDNKPVGSRVAWRQNKGVVNPVDDPAATYSIMDHQHLVLILGTGVAEPMTVQSVRVFQSSPAANLIH